jgi:hypothetical protein
MRKGKMRVKKRKTEQRCFHLLFDLIQKKIIQCITGFIARGRACDYRDGKTCLAKTFAAADWPHLEPHACAQLSVYLIYKEDSRFQ